MNDLSKSNQWWRGLLAVILLANSLLAPWSMARANAAATTPIIPRTATAYNAPPMLPPSADIAVADNGFTPATIVVIVGTEVVWHNDTDASQTVVSGVPTTSPASGTLFLPLIFQKNSNLNGQSTPVEPAAPEGGFRGTMPADGTFRFTFSEAGTFDYYLAGNPIQRGQIIVETQAPDPGGNGPTPPIEVATPIYTGPNAPQTGMDPDTIDPDRVNILRGTIVNREGVSVGGVKITVADHTEYGWSTSRADGTFDMVINGGARVTLNFEHADFLPVQRTFETPWQDYTIVDPIALTALDSQVTTVNPTAPDYQIARGSVQTDPDGARQATLLFPPNTGATIQTADGQLAPLGTMNVRATEYTAGEDAASAMPGTLPATSGFTYAVEFSVDEAMALDATRVDFTNPVASYTENIIGAPVGSAVPVGYYYRTENRWIPADNGRVVKVLSISGDMAVLDVTGSGTPSTAEELAELGITDGELQSLATLYTAGQELWRVAVTHFTPYDYNWPYGPPEGAVPPEGPPTVPEEPNSCQAAGSIIGCEQQTLGEVLPIAGTNYNLMYQSDRVPGYSNAWKLDVPIAGDTIPNGLTGAFVEIQVAGRTFDYYWENVNHEDVPPSDTPDLEPNTTLHFTWDGKDAYGRTVIGRPTAKVKSVYAYQQVYYETEEAFEQSFGQYGNGEVFSEGRGWCGIRDFLCGINATTTTNVSLGIWDARTSDGLGGWTLNVHHGYDPLQHVVHRGDGLQFGTEELGEITNDIAGGGNVEFPDAEGGPATDAAFGFVTDFELGPDGSLYIADSLSGITIYKVDPDGIITALAGNGTASEPTGDGGPALQATLGRNLDGLSVAADGTLYFGTTDINGHGYVRKIDPNGIISTVAGRKVWDQPQNQPDGILAIDTQLGYITDVLVAPDGAFYITENPASGNGWHAFVRRIHADGTIYRVAGGGTDNTADDEDLGAGEPALEAELSHPTALLIAPDGTLYFGDIQEDKVQSVQVDGRIRRVAGNGEADNVGDGRPPLEASVNNPIALAMGRDGTLYVRTTSVNTVIRQIKNGFISHYAGSYDETGCGASNSPDGENIKRTCIGTHSRGLEMAPDGYLMYSDGRYQVRRIYAALPNFDFGNLLVPSADGSELYEFTGNGVHLRTLNAITGAVIYQFRYDADGRFIGVLDAYNNYTRIERDANGNATAIVGPYGHRTALGMNGEGYLSQWASPTGEAYNLTYHAGGLLASMKDPRGNMSKFTYDADGRLTRDEDPATAAQTLARLARNDTLSVTLTSATNFATVFSTEVLTTGERIRTIVFPNGTRRTAVIEENHSAQITDPTGVVTDFVYGEDARWGTRSPRVIKSTMTLPNGVVQERVYEQNVTLSDRTNPMSVTTYEERMTIRQPGQSGQVYVFKYEAAARTITLRTPEGRAWRWVLNAQGDVVEEQLGSLAAIRYTYDSRGRLVRAEQGSGDALRWVTLDYDVNGMLADVQNQSGRREQATYDASGRPTGITQAGGRTVRFGYDAEGNPTSLESPMGYTYRFEFDSRNDHATTHLPSVGGAMDKTQFGYNAAGQPVTVTQADGTQIQMGYSAQGQLTSIAIPGNNRIVAYNNGGLVGNITAPNSTITRTYNSDQLTQERSQGLVNGTVETTYDVYEQPSRHTVNGQNPVDYTYNRDGQLLTAGSLAFTYDASNFYATDATLGGVSESWDYNEFGEGSVYDSKFNATALLHTTYEHDTEGRITKLTETIGGTTTTYEYGYDVGGRLTTVQQNGTVVASYGYDKNDNRISQTVNGTTTTGTTDARDRLSSWGTMTYSYTPSGMLASKGNGNETTRYTYDALGNLTAVTLPNGTVVSYKVDANNRRAVREVNGQVTSRLLYQDDLRPIAELDAGGNVVSRFVYANRGNVPEYMVKGGVTYRLITDHLGSMRLVVNSTTGQIAQRLDYDAWGKVTQDTAPGFQPFGYAGGLYDAQTGLVRFGQRDYDPAIGRWTASDPIMYQGGQTNLYAYVGNDPINFRDPQGTDLERNIERGLAFGSALGTAGRAVFTSTNALVASGGAATTLGNLTLGQLAATGLGIEFFTATGGVAGAGAVGWLIGKGLDGIYTGISGHTLGEDIYDFIYEDKAKVFCPVGPDAYL